MSKQSPVDLREVGHTGAGTRARADVRYSSHMRHCEMDVAVERNVYKLHELRNSKSVSLGAAMSIRRVRLALEEVTAIHCIFRY